MTAATSLTDPAKIDRIIAFAQSAGEGYRIPMLRAARDGKLGLLMVPDGRRVERRFLKMPNPHVVVLLGDCPSDNGPPGWPQANELFDWAHSVVIHATGGQESHYQLIAAMAPFHRRILVVETGFHHHPAWLEVISKRRPHLPVLNIVPPPGSQHPTAPNAREVN